jgi:hypothetical protein
LKGRHVYYGGLSARFWWRYVAGTGVWVLLFYAIWYGVPAWSAHLGGGKAGTWTVTQVDCSGRHCGLVGRFVSDSGVDVRAEVVRTEVPAPTKVGDTLRAVDTGADRVFPPGGGSTWWKATVLGVFAALGCAVWIFAFPVAVLRRRAGTRALGRG